MSSLREPAARRRSFAGRLMAAQALVLLAGAATTWLVATVVAPGIFHEHLQRAGVTHTAEETQHVERAFSSALLISLAVALLIAVAAALAVSWYFSRRVRSSIAPVITAASEVASGTYGVQVPDPGLGGEFHTLTETFNALAARLDAVETTRRRMLADLAHEMRNPLATIDAHLEAVEDGVRDLDATTLQTLRDSTSRLRRLAEDVSAVSRAEEGRLPIHRQPVEADALATRAGSTARDAYAAQGVGLEVNAGAHTIIEVDPERIGQVLTNLLDNALRHTTPGGTVTLTCARLDGQVEYAVEDDGDGIPAEDLPHVFDRFYRVDTARDRRHGGSGIGLTIARALVRAHGGQISAHSDGSGHGARFAVRLPAAG
ncbi:MAG TPA: HAMP domain-containing sensor histidine kinase [Marmoricola sp.]|nr:HAMP domain-containing sensor histidine kinase [Marmoricola sp.]